MDLADVTHELYGLEPGEFTAARNERAKELKADDAALAAQVKALPKPTTAAWLVNQLVRHHGDEVDQVAQIGAALREAQAHLEPGEMLALNKQRHGVLRAVTQQARALARRLGSPVSTAIADEVEQTLRAVMSDPDAADAVRTGTLLRSLSGTGLGSVDLTAAVGLPEGGPAARPGGRPGPAAGPAGGGTGRRGSGGAAAEAGTPTSGTKRTPGTRDELTERRRQHEREQAEREREQAELQRQQRVLDEARRQAEEAETQAASAAETLDRAQESLDELTDQQHRLTDELHSLEQQVRDAGSRLDVVRRDSQAAEHARDEARHSSEVARRAADRARTRLERLT